MNTTPSAHPEEGLSEVEGPSRRTRCRRSFETPLRDGFASSAAPQDERLVGRFLSLPRGHADGAVEADIFAIEIAVLGHEDCEAGIFLGAAEALREEDLGGQR